MVYEGEYRNEISFPLGGIGSGSVGLGGDGRLIDWEIFNRPAKGSITGASHIAVKAKTRNGVITKILNADMNKEFMGKYRGKEAMYSGYGYGPDSASMCGFPHFKNVSFKGEFPFAEITFCDDNFPAQIKLRAFNPFIPLDEKNSSIPGAFFEVEIQNVSDEEIEYQTAFSLINPFALSRNVSLVRGGYNMIRLENAGAEKDDVNYADLTIASPEENSYTQTYWYRGDWKDAVVSFWNDFNSEKDMPKREYKEPGKCKFDGCTLAVKTTIAPSETKSVRFIMSWNAPNNHNDWSEPENELLKSKTWKNYYATIFEDSSDTAEYSLKNWESLYRRTLLFKETLFNSSLDKSVIEAVSATMSVLKSPTVWRLEDGSFYGWEGVHERSGSCEGTCQHVWNYAYALCFLFPNLERSIRDLEFKYSTYENGQMVFRLKLPLGEDKGDFRACLDGQMGSVIKCFREWKISGDDEWLKNNWENIKNILEYAWSKENYDEWDRNKDGVLEGRQHHTLDMELFGPSSWLEGMYLAALAAAVQMAEYLGDSEKAAEYSELFEKGYDWTKENLFNGKYFIQKIDLKDKNIIEHFGAEERYWNEEKNEIKYQIGEGSSIDQLLGQWHAGINGIGKIFDEKQTKTALESMMKNNYKESMREFVNPWRIFSLNDEAGSIICDYPEGAYKPCISVPYCQETMHGFEYQFAGLLAANGMIDDALKVVKAIRGKYDGKKRNPWNEMECGSNYARSMASFALIPILSGFEFHLPKKYIGFNPKVDKENFRCFWSLGTGWGSFSIKGGKAVIEILEGSLTLSSVGLKFAEAVNNLVIDNEKTGFDFKDGIISFSEKKICTSIEIMYE